MRLSFLEKTGPTNITELSVPTPEHRRDHWGTRFVTPDDWKTIKKYSEKILGGQYYETASLMHVINQATEYEFEIYMPSVEALYDEVEAIISRRPAVNSLRNASDNVREAVSQLAVMRQFYGSQLDKLDQMTMNLVKREAFLELSSMESANDMFEVAKFAAQFRVAFPSVSPDTYITKPLFRKLYENVEKLGGVRLALFLRHFKVLYPEEAAQLTSNHLFKVNLISKAAFRNNNQPDQLLRITEAEIILSAPNLKISQDGIVVSDKTTRTQAPSSEVPPIQRSF